MLRWDCSAHRRRAVLLLLRRSTPPGASAAGAADRSLLEEIVGSWAARILEEDPSPGSLVPGPPDRRSWVALNIWARSFSRSLGGRVWSSSAAHLAQLTLSPTWNAAPLSNSA